MELNPITNLERLKLSLGNKQYLTDEQYAILLQEHSLAYDADYDTKNTISKQNLLLTQLDILKTLANNIDMFRSVETEFSNTTEAFQNLRNRIQDVENEINKLPTMQETETPQITFLFHN